MLYIFWSKVPIAAGPNTPWAPQTASVCQADGKPSTRFTSERLVELREIPLDFPADFLHNIFEEI